MGIEEVENKKTMKKEQNKCKIETNNVGNEYDRSGLLQRNVYRKKNRNPNNKWELNK